MQAKAFSSARTQKQITDNLRSPTDQALDNESVHNPVV